MSRWSIGIAILLHIALFALWLEVTESAGSACGDEVMTAMAGALWYHWLPNDRFPAPVEVTEPVTLLAADA